MRLFFRARVPHLRRILLIESGSRAILDRLLPVLRREHGEGLIADIVTCYGGVPNGFQEGVANVYRVTDYVTPVARDRLYALLKANRYEIAGLVCSAEPIMTKWKWMLAARLPVKLFIINENADYFWFDYTNWKTIWHFVMFRAGMSGSDAASTIGRLLLFPFTLIYLLLFAAYVHLRRKIHA